MTLIVNGVNLTPYIAYNSLQYSRNDIDGSGAGRTLDGTMYRDRVAIKDKWEVTCRPLTTDEAAIVLQAIQDEYVTVTVNPHPATNQSKTFEAYSNNVPAQYLMKKGNKEYWEGIAFPLIER